MQQHIYYTKYALQFADMQIPELVTVFNHQVGNTGWTGMRKPIIKQVHLYIVMSLNKKTTKW